MYIGLSDGAPTPFEDRSLYHFVTLKPVKNYIFIPSFYRFLKISIEHVIVFVNTISYISSEYLFVKF